MLKSFLTRTVDFCTRHPWPVIVVALVIAVVSSIYAVKNFAINTQVEKLISDNLPWKQNEAAFEAAFPQRDELILVVVQAPTPENVQQASNLLAERIAEQRNLIRSVRQPGGDEFFARNGQLYAPVGEVEERMTKLLSANSLLNALAVDPSLRGIMDGLSFGSMGVQAGQLKRAFPGASSPWASRPTSRSCAASSRCTRSSTTPSSSPASRQPTPSARQRSTSTSLRSSAPPCG